ncbi:MAG: hypothetical protein JW818_01330 [Pirellulales bacterium]|nr:hypothetical protein [Pirellulales bacterium]
MDRPLTARLLMTDNKGMVDPQEESRLPVTGDEPGEMYDVAPPDPEIVPIKPVFEAPAPPPQDKPGSDSRAELGELQYSLSDLFILTTVIALMLGVIASFSWQWHIAAALAGIAAMAAAIVLATGKVEHPIARRTCWMMMVFYAVSSLAATIAHICK